MIPIGGSNPTRGVVFVNYLLLAANILAFVYELGMSERNLDIFINTWGVRSTEVIALLGGQMELLARISAASSPAYF